MKHAGSLSIAVVAATAALASASPASAGVEEYLGEIMLVGFNFCPLGSVQAAGQLLPIAQNTALFSLYGTIYGGDGRTTFGLPDLRGRSVMGDGTGPGLSARNIGATGGTETRTLSVQEMPSHSHTVNATNEDGNQPGPGGKILAAAPEGGAGNETIYSAVNPNRTMASSMIANTGGNQPHSIQDPFLVMRYCVVTVGIYPSRS